MPEADAGDPPPSPRTVAVFDFDRTLSTRDNFLPFLRSVAGTAAFSAALLAVMPDLARAAAGDRDRRDAAKAKIVRRLLRGRDGAEVGERGCRFAEEIVEQHLRGDVLERVEWHREEGHALIIVSASLGVYLRPVGTALGFDAVLATELALNDDGGVSGSFEGANVRGAEKVRRLDEWLGGATPSIWAYGDSADDCDLLARADHPVLVGRGPLGRMFAGNP